MSPAVLVQNALSLSSPFCVLADLTGFRLTAPPCCVPSTYNLATHKQITSAKSAYSIPINRKLQQILPTHKQHTMESATYQQLACQADISHLAAHTQG